MELTRRKFLKESLATLGFLALPGGLWAAPAGWEPKKKPNLVFGVLSDTHMRVGYGGKSFYEHYDVRFDDQALVMVMKLFKKTGVDAILHCGDVTDCDKSLSCLFVSGEAPLSCPFASATSRRLKRRGEVRRRSFDLSSSL